jgi:hypothetical protein
VDEPGGGERVGVSGREGDLERHSSSLVRAALARWTTPARPFNICGLDPGTSDRSRTE